MASKTTGKAKGRKQTFRPEYTTKWSCISASKRDDFSAYCKLCRADFTIAQGGSNQIQAHLKTRKHISAASSSEKTPNIATFIKEKTDLSVIRAETLMTNYFIDHNIAFAAADHFTDLVKVMFPDSNIAERFACKRTKTTAIARTLGQEAKVDIISKIQQGPFSVSTDGSSDRGAEEQLYPIIVRYNDSGRVVSSLLEIATTKDRSTGKNIFLLLDRVFKENNIPWKNVVAFSADNAAVMMGAQNGVAAFVKKENPDIFILGCPCHLLHLSAEKGASTLPFSPVDILIPVYYYLEKSSKRHKDFKQIQRLCDAENHAILKHVCTRWLSLERALERLLEQWVPLKLYFQQESQSAGANQPKKQMVVQKVHEQSSCSASQRSQNSSKLHSKGEDGSVGGKRRMMNDPHGNRKKQKVSQMKSREQSPANGSFGIAGQNSKKSTDAKSTSHSKKVQQRQLMDNSKASVFKGVKAVPSSSAEKITPAPLSRNVGKEVTSELKKGGNKSKTSLKSSGAKLKSSKISPRSTSASTFSSSTKSTSSSTSSVGKAAQIRAQLSDYNKLYCLFLLNTIPLFNKLNLELQEEEPQVHKLHQKFQDFLRSVLLRFVKPTVIVGASSFQQCAYKDKSNQREDKDLIVGQKVREFLASADFSAKQKEEFHGSVRRYFVAVTDYVIAKFPLQDEVLRHAEVADPSKRLQASFSSVAYFSHKFHYMEDKLDCLELEFAQYQIEELSSLSVDKRVDEVWGEIACLKDHTTGQMMYANLAKIMLAILSLPHSNADDERLFSLVRKNSTEYRPSLSTATLSDFLTQKVQNQARKLSCYQVKFPDKVLEKCKKAAGAYNKSS